MFPIVRTKSEKIVARKFKSRDYDVSILSCSVTAIGRKEAITQCSLNEKLYKTQVPVKEKNHKAMSSNRFISGVKFRQNGGKASGSMSAGK